MKLILMSILFLSAFVKAKTARDILEEGIERKVVTFMNSEQSVGSLTALELAHSFENEGVRAVLEEGIARKEEFVKTRQLFVTDFALAWIFGNEEVRAMLIEGMNVKANRNFEAYVESERHSKSLSALDLEFVSEIVLDDEEVRAILYEDIKKRIEAFLDAEYAESQGLTALDWAQRMGNAEILYILDEGFKKRTKALLEETQETALDSARKMGNEEIIAILEESS